MKIIKLMLKKFLNLKINGISFIFILKSAFYAWLRNSVNKWDICNDKVALKTEETYKRSGDFRILGSFSLNPLRDAILKAFLSEVHLKSWAWRR